MITYQLLQGEKIQDFIEEIARLRIEIFREFPYLYDGNYEYETKYLKKFADIDESIVVLALDENKVIGAFTSLPMRFEQEGVKQEIPSDWIKNAFYLSEIVLEKTYRKQGIGRTMFQLMLDRINTLQKYNRILFASIEREENHPFKPKDYTSNDEIWIKQGFQKTPYRSTISWKEINEVTESSKELSIWEKEI
jgi:GNAT superfamily N-acetyltransferase